MFLSILFACVGVSSFGGEDFFWPAGAYLTVETSPPMEILSAVKAVAEAVRPGAGEEFFENFLEENFGLGEEIGTLQALFKDAGPVTVAFLDAKRYPSGFVLVVGDPGPVSLLDRIVGQLGLENRREGEDIVLGEDDDALRVRRLQSGWLVVSKDAAAIQSACEAIRRGRLPRRPSGGAQVGLRLDVREFLAAYGDEFQASLVGIKLGVALQVMQLPGPFANILGGLMVGMIEVMEALFKENMAAVELRAKLAAPMCELSLKISSRDGTPLRDIISKLRPSRWTAARVLPKCQILAMAGRLEPGACDGLAELLGRGLAQIAGKEEVATRYVSTLKTILSPSEMAVSLSQKGGVQQVCCAAGYDITSYRALFKDGLPLMDLISPLYKAMGVETRFRYDVAYRQLPSGGPVDRAVLELSAEGLQAEALEKALAVWGGTWPVSEIASTDWGVVIASGADSGGLLEEALRRSTKGASFAGRGWPEASEELRNALAEAPESAVLAGEFRLGAYVVFLSEMMRKVAPGAAGSFKGVEDLEANDPPFVFWVTSDGRSLTHNLRVPLESVRNMIEHFGGGEEEEERVELDNIEILQNLLEGNEEGDEDKEDEHAPPEHGLFNW